MEVNWKKYSLDELCIKVTDGSHQSPKAYDNGYPMYSVKDMTEYGFNSKGTKTISKEDYIKLSGQGCKPNINDILIAKDGSVMKHVFKVEKEIRGVLLSSIAIIRPHTNLVDPDFLALSLLSPVVKNNILNNYVSGSGVPRIVLKDFKKILLNVPDLEKQRKISKIIVDINKKISLNTKINETLEKLAQALFKSWFVDFDPVKAKEKLKQEGCDLNSIAKELGMSKEILELFPDEFEESELGLIPKGWGLKPLYETAEYINGSAFKATDFSDNNEGLPIIKIVELKQGVSAGTKFTLNEVKSKYFIDSGDVLYSWSGSPDTSLEVFKWHGGKGWLNQHIFKLNFDSLQQRNFTYFLLKQIKPLLISTAKQKQTTGLGHITVADMKRIKIVYPDNGVLKKFSEKINPLYERSSKLIEEIGVLTQLRDTLLPNLLSGEITFKDQA